MATLFRTLRNLSVQNKEEVVDEASLTDQELIERIAKELPNDRRKEIVLPSCTNSPLVLELEKSLKQWINECLVEDRIIVKDLAEDLFDGQVLQKLYERLQDEVMDKPDIVCTRAGQLAKLKDVLYRIAQTITPRHRELFDDTDEDRENYVELIYSKNYRAICYLLVVLTKHYEEKCNVRLPDQVPMKCMVIEKTADGEIKKTPYDEIIYTSDAMSGYGTSTIPDKFDLMEQKHPAQFEKLKGKLLLFVASKLKDLGVEEDTLEDISTAFCDGVNLIMLIGLLDGYFVSQHSYNMPAETDDKKLKNVELALDLINEAGCSKCKVRTREIVAGDVKSTLRVIFSIYERFAVRVA